MKADTDADSPGSWIPVRLSGRLVVVVGGGTAAALAVGMLLGAGARVLVVAPELTDVLADLAARGLITARRRGYLADDLEDAWLVLTCANQEGVNARVTADAERRHIWSVSGHDPAVMAPTRPSPGLPASAVGSRPAAPPVPPDRRRPLLRRPRAREEACGACMPACASA